MRNKKLAVRAMVATLAVGLALGTASMAGAATATFSANVNTNSTWTNYSTDRMTSGTVAFAPNNLLYQAGPVNSLSLRLNHGGTSTPMSNSTQWLDTYANKTIMSGILPNTSFRLSACCYSTTGNDSSWGGTLSH